MNRFLPVAVMSCCGGLASIQELGGFEVLDGFLG